MLPLKPGSTISTSLHDRINPKDCQVLSLGDSRFLQFFGVVSSDYGKPLKLTARPPPPLKFIVVFVENEIPSFGRDPLGVVGDMGHVQEGIPTSFLKKGAHP